MKTTRNQFIYAGVLIPIVFWSTLGLCGILREDYSHLSNLVSELGALGTPTQLLFTLGLCLCSLLSLVFVLGLYRACRNAQISVIPILVILTYTFSIAGAAIFPMPHRLHGILGLPSAFLLLSPILAVVLWKEKSSPVGMLLFSGLSFLMFALGFLVFFPDVLDDYFGLKQRFFHAGWSIWFAYLSIGLSGILERTAKGQNPIISEQ